MNDHERRMNEILDHGIKPHAKKIAEILLRGGIAVCVYEPSPVIFSALPWNWRGQAVFKMTQSHRRAMIEVCKETGDEAGRRWFSEKRNDGRIFLLCRDGTLLVNYEPSDGFSIEPGSTDAERRAMSH